MVDLQRSLPESSTYTTWEACKLRNPALFQQANGIEMCEYVVYHDRHAMAVLLAWIHSSLKTYYHQQCFDEPRADAERTAEACFNYVV